MNRLIPLIYVNEVCFLSDKIDEKKLGASLEEAQVDLRDLLGPEFYTEIEGQYPSSFTSANDTLYEDYIKKFLAWQTYFYFLGFSQTDSTPTGERSFTDENSTLATDFALYAKEKNIKRRAMRYRYDLLNYLRLQQSILSTNFPLYTESCQQEFSFAITSVERGGQDAVISVNRAILNNE